MADRGGSPKGARGLKIANTLWLNTSFLSTVVTCLLPLFDASNLNQGCHGEFAMCMSCRHDSFFLVDWHTRSNGAAMLLFSLSFCFACRLLKVFALSYTYLWYVCRWGKTNGSWGVMFSYSMVPKSGNEQGRLGRRFWSVDRTHIIGVLFERAVGGVVWTGVLARGLFLFVWISSVLLWVHESRCPWSSIALWSRTEERPISAGMSFGQSFSCWQRCRVGTQLTRGWPDSGCFWKATRFLSSARWSQQTRKTRRRSLR